MAAVKELSRLEEIGLREIWPDEAQNFTPWLAQEENLSLLGETLGMELELEAQEINVGDFRADILCKSDDDSWVLIENQLGETDHKHLGQILTYAAGLDVYTVIWIAKKFRDDHRAALDRQNEITDERFQYFGVEIKVWQIGESAYAPQFEIVSKPNDWNRTVSRETQRAERENVSETRRKKFWAQFRDSMIHRGSQLQARDRKSTRYLIFDIGRRSFAMKAWMSKLRRELGVELYMTGQNKVAHFHLLKERREKIKDEFGESLKWEEERCRAFLWQDDVDPTDESDWPNQHEWLALKLEKFNEVFRPRVKALDASDWELSEDEDDE